MGGQTDDGSIQGLESKWFPRPVSQTTRPYQSKKNQKRAKYQSDTSKCKITALISLLPPLSLHSPPPSRMNTAREARAGTHTGPNVPVALPAQAIPALVNRMALTNCGCSLALSSARGCMPSRTHAYLSHRRTPALSRYCSAATTSSRLPSCCVVLHVRRPLRLTPVNLQLPF